MTTAAVPVGQFTEGSPEWQAARDGAITGSRIAAVCGLSPWESPFSLWHRMMGIAPEQPVTDLMHWGTKLEPVILSEYADRRAHVGHQLVIKPGIYRHHERTWQMVTTDAIDGDRIVEVKYAPVTEGWGDEGTDEIPVYYRCQVQWQMDVFGFEQATVATFFGGRSEYREYTVDRDPADIAVLLEKAVAFLASINGGDRPDIDGHAATYQVVREMHPDIDDVRCDLPNDVAGRYLAALTWLDAAQTAKQAAVSEVLDTMGRARRAFHKGQQIAMRIPHKTAPPFLRPTLPKATGQTVRTATP
jgi:putative phage-type endonuclease